MNQTPSPCHYRIEFPDFGELDVQLPEGFVDSSWHNDAMPSFEKQLPCGNTMRLWIDYVDLAKSEIKVERFVLCLYDSDHNTINPAMFLTDSYASMERFIEQHQ